MDAKIEQPSGIRGRLRRCLKKIRPKAVFTMFLLFIVFIGRGLCLDTLGPSLLDLNQVSGSSNGMDHSWLILLSQASGIFIGTLVSHYIEKRAMSKDLTLATCCTLQAIACVLIPSASSLVAMLAFLGLQGIAIGVMATVVSNYCVIVGGKNNGPLFQTLYLGVAIGAFSGPIIAKPFLSEELSDTETMGKHITTASLKSLPTIAAPSIPSIFNNSTLPSYEPKFGPTNVFYFYILMGLASILPVPGFVALACNRCRRTALKRNKKQRERSRSDQRKKIANYQSIQTDEKQEAQTQNSEETDSQNSETDTSSLAKVSEAAALISSTRSLPSKHITPPKETPVLTSSSNSSASASNHTTSPINGIIVSQNDSLHIASQNDTMAETELIKSVALYEPGEGLVLALLFFICFIYYGIQDAYAQILTSYCVYNPLKMGKSMGLMATSILWATIGGVRIIAVGLALFVRPQTFLIVDLGGMLAGGILLLVLGNQYKVVLLIVTVLFGLSFATFNGAGISWATRYLRGNPWNMTVIFLGRCLGMMTIPVAATKFLSPAESDKPSSGGDSALVDTIQSFPIIILASTLALILVFIIALITIGKYRYQVGGDKSTSATAPTSTSYLLANENEDVEDALKEYRRTVARTLSIT